MFVLVFCEFAHFTHTPTKEESRTHNDGIVVSVVVVGGCCRVSLFGGRDRLRFGRGLVLCCGCCWLVSRGGYGPSIQLVSSSCSQRTQHMMSCSAHSNYFS